MSINTDYSQYRAWAELNLNVKPLYKPTLEELAIYLVKSKVDVAKYRRTRGKAKL